MIKIDIVNNLNNDFEEYLIFIKDGEDIFNIEFYKNKYGEQVIKLDCWGDIIKLCEFNQCEIQKSIMFLLERI